MGKELLFLSRNMHTPQSDPMHLTWVSQQVGHIPLPEIGRREHIQSSEDHNGKYLMDADMAELK